jgi:hypothetical protein
LSSSRGVLEKLLAPARVVKALVNHLRTPRGRDDSVDLRNAIFPKNVLEQMISDMYKRFEHTRSQSKEVRQASTLPAQPKSDLGVEELRSSALYVLAQDPFVNREALVTLFRDSTLPPRSRPPSRRGAAKKNESHKQPSKPRKRK